MPAFFSKTDIGLERKRVGRCEFVKFYFNLLVGGAIPALVHAHHSPNVHYDRNEVVEIAGVLSDVKWQNPHVQLTVTVVGENGEEVDWIVDEVSAVNQSRRGVSAEEYQVGAPIHVAGFRGLRNRTAIFPTNTLLSSGRELVSRQSTGPLWTQNVVEDQPAATGDTVDATLGIFRVWGRAAFTRESGRVGSQLWIDSYPLTDEAREVQAGWDRIADNPYLRCQNGMPAIMDSNHPMQIMQEGGNILIRLEELDLVRTVYLEDSPDAARSNPYGHSVGSWEGETLVVTTTAVDWPWFDQSGVPQSGQLQLVERFRVNDDDRYLYYSVTATDPEVFFEPVTLEKRWIAIPGQEIMPYQCSWERDDL